MLIFQERCFLIPLFSDKTWISKRKKNQFRCQTSLETPSFVKKRNTFYLYATNDRQKREKAKPSEHL